MKTCVFGCKSTTAYLVRNILKWRTVDLVVTISPETGRKNQVADYTNLTTLCNELDVPVYVAKRYDLRAAEDLAYLEQAGLDVAFAVGWQRLIPQAVLQAFNVGVFGMHGSAEDLPFGRGRSPMNWALIERRRHFTTNLFRYDPGVDDGDVLDSLTFSIQSADTAETMHFKNVMAMKELVLRNLDLLARGEFDLVPQSDEMPTFYPKRSPEDSQIDWTRDVFQLDAFVRAVAEPFGGAFSFLDEDLIRLHRVAILDTSLVDFGHNRQPWGCVVETFENGKFVIACNGGMLLVHEHEFVRDISVGDQLKVVGELKMFALNTRGHFDLP